jgi:hypothetical protein
MENLETPNNEKINANNPFIAEPEVSLGKNALIYGLILGGINVAYSIILWVLGQSMNKSLAYISFIFIIGIMFYGTKEYRDKHLGGYMMYGKAFTSNFLISLYACIIGSVYTFLLYKFIDPGMIDTIKEAAIGAAMQKNPNITQEQIEKSMSMFSFFMTPLGFAFSALFGGAFYSAILGLIVSIFHKKEQPLL